MKQVKVFLSYCCDKGRWETNVFRDVDDLEPFLQNLNECHKLRIIHVGLSNVQLSNIELNIHPSYIYTLATRSTFYCLSEILKYLEHPIGPNSDLYIITEGLGVTVQEKIGSEYANYYLESFDETISSYLKSHQNLRDLFNRNQIRTMKDLASSTLSEVKQSILEIQVQHFKKVKDALNKNSIYEVILHYPEILLRENVKKLNLSVRATNVFKNYEISTIGDLARYDDFQLLALKNMGKLSYKEICDSLVEYACNYSIHSFGNNGNDSGFVVSCYSEYVNLIERDLEYRKWSILKYKWSTIDDLNYEEISKIENLSRERVRQLFNGIKETLESKQYIRSIEFELKNIISCHDIPITVAGLVSLSKWFDEKVEVGLLKYLLSEVIESDVNILEIDGCAYISDISKTEFDLLIRSTTEELETSCLNELLTETSFDTYIENKFSIKGRTLLSVIMDRIKSKFIFDMFNGIRIVLGSDIITQILNYLRLQNSPVHYSDIYRYFHKLDNSITENYIHVYVQKVPNYILFNRGTYGLPVHFPFSKEQIVQICMVAKGVLETNAERQWHSNELLDSLDFEQDSIRDILNQYLLYEALKNDPNVECLGRNIVKLKGTGDYFKHRIQINQLIESILIEKGRPLTTNELKNEINEIRGLGEIFQVIPRKNIVRISDSLWGLKYRDILFPDDYQKEIALTIYSELVNIQTGIPIQSLSKIIKDKLGDKIESILCLTIAQLFYENIRISPSEFVYLNEWGNSRVPAVIDIIKEIFTNQKMPLSISEISQFYFERTNQNVNTSRFYSSFKLLGITYDEIDKKWVCPASACNFGDE